MEELLAKKNPNESLISHTNCVLSVWDIVFQQYRPIIPNDSFWDDSYISVLLHDIGKATLNFQDVMYNRVRNNDNYIRHELYSGAFILLNDKAKFLKNPLPILSVFSHHKDLVEGVFDRENDYVEICINEESYRALIAWYQKKLNQKGIELNLNSDVFSVLPSRLVVGQLIIWFKRFLLGTSVSFIRSTRREYIYIKAILTICDWLGSAHEFPKEGIVYNKKYLEEKIVSKLKNEGKTEIADSFKFRHFQSESTLPCSVIAIAPTGSGKTEAALLWASQKKAEERIIYLLPTRVTSNAIYNRLLQYFDEGSVAIVHSSALFFRKETNDNYDQKEYLKARTFFQNVNVCTIDQVLTQGFNLGYWELKTFHMMNSWVVIDEIHLYAPYTLALIISTISYLKSEFGTRFFIMSATMPLKLQNLLKKTLGEGNYSLIQDKELLDQSRNIFETRNCLVDELFEEIIDSIESGKKVLIVVNTVDEAIRVYSSLKSYASKAFCYHSRFMQKDRLDKEKEILLAENSDESLLLVATQVVEVSLDIDFDILFTENAPIDAIVQRAGRVNRKRSKAGTKIVVFRETEITREWVYDVAGILENTFTEIQSHNGETLTEQLLLEMVDKVYSDIDIESDRHFTDGMKKYLDIQRNLHYIKDNVNKDEVYTREGLDTISVIPMKNNANKYGEEEDYWSIEFKNKSAMEKAKHELSVRKSKKFSFPILKDDWGFNYIDTEYSYEHGMILKQENKSTIS